MEAPGGGAVRQDRQTCRGRRRKVRYSVTLVATKNGTIHSLVERTTCGRSYHPSVISAAASFIIGMGIAALLSPISPCT